MRAKSARLMLSLAAVTALGAYAYLGQEAEVTCPPGARPGSALPAWGLAHGPEVREFQQRLEKTGLSPEAVHRIVERFEPAREVFLSETHAIEGRGKEGAAQAMMAARDRLAVRLQAELGPVDYDWALYANERSNRVVVNGVPPDADSNGGLTAGDIFFSYAGQRIFTRDDLRRARAQSVDEALIPARLVRGTVWIDAKLPAEPLESLGFRFDDRREQPPELPAASQDNLVAHGS